MGGGDGANPYHITPISARLSIILEADPDQQLPLMYCIAGESRVVLIDTGCASGDLKAIVEKYCNPRGLPILVVCTHSHHDHLGCNFRFADPAGELSSGSLGVALSAFDKRFTSDYMKWSGAKEMGYPLKPFGITRWLADGEQVILSDSNPSDSLTIFHMPGHGPDEIAVYDPLERRLFVGDIINRYSPICIFSYGANFDQFVESIYKLMAFVESKNGFHPAHLIMLSCGHVDENLHPKYLKDLRALLQDVISGNLKPEVLTSRVSAYNRGGEMWITVNTKEGEELSRADFLAGIGSPPDPKSEAEKVLAKRNTLSWESRFRCRVN